MRRTRKERKWEGSSVWDLMGLCCCHTDQSVCNHLQIHYYPVQNEVITVHFPGWNWAVNIFDRTPFCHGQPNVLNYCITCCSNAHSDGRVYQKELNAQTGVSVEVWTPTGPKGARLNPRQTVRDRKCAAFMGRRSIASCASASHDTILKSPLARFRLLYHYAALTQRDRAITEKTNS